MLNEYEYLNNFNWLKLVACSWRQERELRRESSVSTSDFCFFVSSTGQKEPFKGVHVSLRRLCVMTERSSGRADFRLVQQFINLGSSPNNRQDFQHPSSSLASKSTTKEQRQQIILLFFTLYRLHINFLSLMLLLSQIASSSKDEVKKLRKPIKFGWQKGACGTGIDYFFLPPAVAAPRHKKCSRLFLRSTPVIFLPALTTEQN